MTFSCARTAQSAVFKAPKPFLSARAAFLFVSYTNHLWITLTNWPGSRPKQCRCLLCSTFSKEPVGSSPGLYRFSIKSRSFSTTRHLQKKGGKAARDESKAASKSKDSNEDPFDFSALEGDIANAIEKLKNDLSKLRAGGRFNPEALESLRVQPDKNNKQSIKLSDLAQVIPKGRTVQVLVGEKDVCCEHTRMIWDYC